MKSPLEQCALEFRDERADKVYHLELRYAAGAFIVHAAFGRRGSTLQQQDWDIVDETAARKLYETKRKEKLAKGYREIKPSENGVVIKVLGELPMPAEFDPRSVACPDCKAKAGSPCKRPSGHRVFGGGFHKARETATPISDDVKASIRRSAAKIVAEARVPALVAMPAHQLCNAIEEDVAPKFVANGWWMQPKFDGVRAYVRKCADTLEACSRTFKPVAIAAPVREAAMAIAGDWIIDGEMCGDVFIAFDLLWLEQATTACLPYHDRLTMLEGLLGMMDTTVNPVEGCRVPVVARAIQVTQTWVTPDIKAKAMPLYRELGGEGVVFKDPNQRHQPGRPNSGGVALKCKFVATATVQVIAKPKEDGKRSVQMAVNAAGTWRDVGTVTIPPNKNVPARGSLIEVRYLYAFRGGSLVQAVFLGVREDKANADDYTSLRFKEEPRS